MASNSRQFNNKCPKPVQKRNQLLSSLSRITLRPLNNHKVKLISLLMNTSSNNLAIHHSQRYGTRRNCLKSKRKRRSYFSSSCSNKMKCWWTISLKGLVHLWDTQMFNNNSWISRANSFNANLISKKVRLQVKANITRMLPSKLWVMDSKVLKESHLLKPWAKGLNNRVTQYPSAKMECPKSKDVKEDREEEKIRTRPLRIKQKTRMARKIFSVTSKFLAI